MLTFPPYVIPFMKHLLQYVPGRCRGGWPKRFTCDFQLLLLGPMRCVPLISFPTMLCRRAEWGNWLGSGLFQNILAVARKRGKLSFTKLYLWNWIGWEQDGLAAPAQVHTYNKDHPYTAVFLTVRTHLKGCHWDQLEVRLHLLVKGEAGMVENINETHHDPKNGRPWLARRKK